LKCSSDPYSTGNVVNSVCECKSPMIWNPNLLKCDCILNSILITNVGDGTWSCLACSSMDQSTGNSINSLSCICNDGYVWSIVSGVGKCVCDTSKSAKISESVCIKCSGNVQFSTGVGLTADQCACPSYLKWKYDSSLQTGACVCEDPLTIINNDGSACICNSVFAITKSPNCFDCRTVLYSTNTPNADNPT